MKLRRQKVEHPFGKIKFWLGTRHFLTRTLNRVNTIDPATFIRESCGTFHTQTLEVIFDAFRVVGAISVA